MPRRRLKSFGAALALAALLVLQLHALAHVFGVDHDDDARAGKGGKAAPCALCQAVLAQHTLSAAPSVEAPEAPPRWIAPPADQAPAPLALFVPTLEARGPPLFV